MSIEDGGGDEKGPKKIAQFPRSRMTLPPEELEKRAKEQEEKWDRQALFTLAHMAPVVSAMSQDALGTARESFNQQHEGWNSGNFAQFLTDDPAVLDSQEGLFRYFVAEAYERIRNLSVTPSDSSVTDPEIEKVTRGENSFYFTSNEKILEDGYRDIIKLIDTLLLLGPVDDAAKAVIWNQKERFKRMSYDLAHTLFDISSGDEVVWRNRPEIYHALVQLAFEKIKVLDGEQISTVPQEVRKALIKYVQLIS